MPRSNKLVRLLLPDTIEPVNFLLPRLLMFRWTSVSDKHGS